MSQVTPRSDTTRPVRAGVSLMDLTRIFLSWANVVLSRSRWWTTPLHQTADEDLAVTQDEVQRDELSGDSLVPRRGAHQAGCEVPSRRVAMGRSFCSAAELMLVA